MGMWHIWPELHTCLYIVCASNEAYGETEQMLGLNSHLSFAAVRAYGISTKTSEKGSYVLFDKSCNNGNPLS